MARLDKTFHEPLVEAKQMQPKHLCLLVTGCVLLLVFLTIAAQQYQADDPEVKVFLHRGLAACWTGCLCGIISFLPHGNDVLPFVLLGQLIIGIVVGLLALLFEMEVLWDVCVGLLLAIPTGLARLAVPLARSQLQPVRAQPLFFTSPPMAHPTPLTPVDQSSLADSTTTVSTTL
eukprot:TRINITY_DN79804_c0_g1_i1.p1 TRINITY_DN79804_c0_g1~~TRINITY_DN79804_c0_g1_i1.p1  ORF type:complete len:175 (+),score=20.52 TRINITY_DN79804_c0_g1_i1:23-547(+)